MPNWLILVLSIIICGAFVLGIRKFCKGDIINIPGPDDFMSQPPDLEF